MIFEYCRNLGNGEIRSLESRNAGTWWMFKTEARMGGGGERGEGNFEAGPDRRMSISDRPLRGAAAVSRLWSVARVLNSLSSRRSFKSAWNSRAGRFIRNRRTIRDKLVSRLEESLVNSSHRENCFQYCTVCNNIGCSKNVGISVNWRSLRGIIFLCR